MNKELLAHIVVDQKEALEEALENGTIIPRDGYSDCLPAIATPNVLLISGLRRIGKSIFSHLLARNKPYAFLSFDDERLIGFTSSDFNTVIECFFESSTEPEYLLFDEIQNINGWELFVSRLRQKYRVIITGSNANLLSSEMATHLTGRFIAFPLFPMNFREYLLYKGKKTKTTDYIGTKKNVEIHLAFQEYLLSGGIFENYKFGKPYLRELFRSIITRDIIGRYKIGYPVVLEELAMLLLNNFSSKFSANNLANQLKVKSFHTIQEYFKYLENTFLFISISKFSYKLKEQQASQKKIYLIDNGFIAALSFSFSDNKGRLLENIVAIELRARTLRKYQELFYWDDYKHECDFVVKEGKNVIMAYQVCLEITPQNEKREFTGLIEAMKFFKLERGIILTYEQKEIRKHDDFTIELVPAWEWMLS